VLLLGGQNYRLVTVILFSAEMNVKKIVIGEVTTDWDASGPTVFVPSKSIQRQIGQARHR